MTKTSIDGSSSSHHYSYSKLLLPPCFNSTTVYTKGNEDQDFLYDNPATPNLRSKKRCWKFLSKNSLTMEPTRPQSWRIRMWNRVICSLIERVGFFPALERPSPAAYAKSWKRHSNGFIFEYTETCYWSFSCRHHDLAPSRKFSQFIRYTFCLFYCIDWISPLCLFDWGLKYWI